MIRARQRGVRLLAIALLVLALLTACAGSIDQPNGGTTGNNSAGQQTQPNLAGQPTQAGQSAKQTATVQAVKETPTAQAAKETPTAKAANGTPTAQSGNSGASQVQSVDQQIQDALQSLDQTQQDANKNNSSQDNGQQP